MNNSNTSFYLFTALVFILVFGIGIFTDGMFADGIFYANVANNYAQGFGSFWMMFWGNTPESVFHDQPPLAIFLQAQFFKLLGDTIFAERIYSFVFAIIHLYLIKCLWKEIVRSDKYDWLPMLLYIVIPLCAFTFRQNLIEVTMSVFDMLAVLFFFRGCQRNNYMHLLLGSAFVFLASMSKGMQGLFPLITPIAYWLVWRKNAFFHALLQSLIAVSIPIVIYAVFYFIPEINYSYVKYFEKRIVGTFNHLQDTKESHLYLFFKLWFELLAAIGVVLILWLWSITKKVEYLQDWKAVSFLLIIGFSGSLPLMVTLEQRAFYLTTSLPYFVLAIGIFALPLVDGIIKSGAHKNYRALNLFLAACVISSIVIVIIKAGEPKRDKDLLTDLYTIKANVPPRTAVTASVELSKNWQYKNYFMRYCYINFDTTSRRKYFLAEGKTATPPDACYRNMQLPLKKFTLYICDEM